jgi:hypothetical protein
MRTTTNAAAMQPATNGEDYERDSFRIHVEQRTNGWGFRIQSSQFFCLLCFGGFESKFDALEFADELIELCETNLE